MIILSLGGWYVGNSAVLDWLSGYPDNCFLKGDLHEFRNESGLYDLILTEGKDLKVLRANLMYHFKGMVRGILNLFGSFIGRQINKNHSYSFKYNFIIFVEILRFFSKSKFEKKIDSINYWKSFFDNSMKRFDKVSNALVLQNPVYYDDVSPKHIKVWRTIFNNKKIVFVHRDPIDQFIDIFRANDLAYGPSKFREGTKNLNNIQRFFYIVRKTYVSRIKLLNEFSKNELVVIDFEKFAFSKCQKEKIYSLESFFDIGTTRTNSFDFEYTQNNVNMSKKYPEIASLLTDYQDEIEEINKLRRMLSSTEHSII